MGFGSSRTEARQIVRHNGVLVNGKRVNMPSYQVRPGDTVEVAATAKEQLRVKGALTAAETRGFPDWIEVDVKNERQVQGAARALRAALHDQRKPGRRAVFEISVRSNVRAFTFEIAPH